MKSIYEVCDDTNTLNILEGLLDPSNKSKVIELSDNMIFTMWKAVSTDDIENELWEAMHGNKRSLEKISKLPHVDKIFSAVGERKGCVMLTWLTSAVAGLNMSSAQTACKVIGDYFNKILGAGGIDKFIGAGMEGFVVDAGDQIIKVFYKPISSTNKAFYELAKTKKYKTLPRITHLTNRTVAMEKLEVTSDLQHVDSSVQRFCNKASSSFVNDNDPKVQLALDELEKIAQELDWKKYMFDINIWNVGLRKNGDIVLFDC